MNNLIKSVFYEVIAEIIFLIIEIVLFVKNRHKAINVIFIFIFLFAFLGNSINKTFPFYKDMKYQETKIFEGVYIEDYSSLHSIPMFGMPVYFDTNKDGKKDNYFWVPNGNRSRYKLKKGKKYRVTIYKNSHTIHSLELIE